MGVGGGTSVGVPAGCSLDEESGVGVDVGVVFSVAVVSAGGVSVGVTEVSEGVSVGVVFVS